MRRRVLLVLILLVAGIAAWGIFRFTSERRNRLFQSASELSNLAANSATYSWDAAVDKVKEPRGEELGGVLEVPPELKHYEERYWFLATQVAEIDKQNVHTVQDYLDLAAMIERGELVPVPAVTKTYILLGVGQRANEEPFTKFDEEDKAATVSPDEYQAVQKLAQNFNGRSFDLENPYDRHVLKINMLSTIRPQALKIIEEVSAAYQQKFDRPLPVSSLVRPEQYQHSLRRVNRNAVTIDTPPHSTGLAFDIDYRYMSVAEQNFLMTELARIKNEGRIEVIRERNANYHVFAFLNGTRPSDDLVAASLEKAGAPPPDEANHTEAKPAKTKVRVAKRTLPKKRAKAHATPGGSQSKTTGAVKAATENAILRNDLVWTFGGKQQRGWYLYDLLIGETLNVSSDPLTNDFAAALGSWKKKHGLNANGVLDEDTLMALISQWQSNRLKNRAPATPDQLLTAPPSDFFDPSRAEELRQVERSTYAAYKKMIAAAFADRSLKLAPGQQYLKIISSFRSREYQENLRRQSPNSGSAGLAVNSPHFTGRALDLYVGGSPVDTSDSNRAIQVNTPVYRWLVRNAGRFGFRPYFYEPWHWEYVK